MQVIFDMQPKAMLTLTHNVAIAFANQNNNTESKIMHFF